MGSKKSKPVNTQSASKPAAAAPKMDTAQKATSAPVGGASKPAAAGASSPSPAGTTATKQKTFKETYTLGKELGKGNYSVVRLATNIQTGEQVAVKCIIKKKLTKEDEDALKIEVAVLREVNHPTIIKLFGFFDDVGLDFYYLATELMSGGELFDRIVKKEFYSEVDAQHVVRTLAECIKYLHDRDIVHRDLKPENILLKDQTDDAAIKIADFGFARHIKEGCRTACGTPGYVAPEIINGKVYGKSVDVWSMGVITYILLCGYPPFYNNNQAQLFKTIREGRFVFDAPYWDPISGDAKNFIKGMLTVDVSKRLTVDEALNHKWMKDAASGINIGATTLAELKKFNARRRLRAGIRAAIAANTLSDIAERVKHTRNA